MRVLSDLIHMHCRTCLRSHRRRLSWSTDHEFHYRSLTPLQHCLMSSGSSLVSLLAPWRGDMVKACVETTSGFSAMRLQQLLLQYDEGIRILQDKPRINTTSVSYDRLSSLADESFGKLSGCHAFFIKIKTKLDDGERHQWSLITKTFACIMMLLALCQFVLFRNPFYSIFLRVQII